MTITKRDINKAMEALDPDLKIDFLNMTREEQLTVILSLEGSNSNRLANVERWQIDFEVSNRSYRKEREKRENNNDGEVMSTTQKILKMIADSEAKKFNLGIYLRDHVLPNILSPAILILIYLIATQLKP